MAGENSHSHQLHALNLPPVVSRYPPAFHANGSASDVCPCHEGSLAVYQRYDDIFSRINEPPHWFDEYAVPRYCAFAPDKLANIYASEAVLAEIACQVCKHLFRVAFSEANWRSGTVADAIRSRTLTFGDPPNYCCCNNAHMSSEPRKVIQYWRRHDPKYTRLDGDSVIVSDLAFNSWARDTSLEIDIRPDWVDPL
jgi:hypothetical protein